MALRILVSIGSGNGLVPSVGPPEVHFLIFQSKFNNLHLINTFEKSSVKTSILIRSQWVNIRTCQSRRWRHNANHYFNGAKHIEVETKWPLSYRRHFLVCNTFSCVQIFVFGFFRVPLKFVPNGPISNYPAWVQTLAWRQTGDKRTHEPMMT